MGYELSTIEARRTSGGDGVYAGCSDVLGLYVIITVEGGQVVAITFARERPEGNMKSHPFLLRILSHIDSGSDDLRDIPVGLRATPFVRDVLEALRDIPIGDVVTYGEIAERLDRPGAARAVGSACARNPIPILIPCHRVVPAGGGLGNYSGAGGRATKRILLEREGALHKVRGRNKHRSSER